MSRSFFRRGLHSWGMPALLLALPLLAMSAGTANSETVLHTFTGGAEGSNPYGGLVLGADGSLYGTTQYGGGSDKLGTVFKVTPAGQFTNLYSFAGPDGGKPYAPLVQASDGNFYGTTYLGGANGFGEVFRL